MGFLGQVHLVSPQAAGGRHWIKYNQGQFIPDPGSRVDKIPDPDPHRKIKVFLTQKTDTEFSKEKTRMFIPDSVSGFFPSHGSRNRTPDPGVEKQRIMDPEPQHCSSPFHHLSCWIRNQVYEVRLNFEKENLASS